MIQLHETVMGQQFFLRDIPTLIDELARLNRNIEALNTRISSLAPEQEPNTEEAKLSSGE